MPSLPKEPSRLSRLEQKLLFSLRVSEELLDKVKQLAAAHKRSANKEIEFALEQYVAAYEQEHGSIRLPPQA